MAPKNLQTSALARFLIETTRSWKLEDIPNFLLAFLKDFIVPIAIVLICIAGFLKLLIRIYRLIIPYPPPIRHQQIQKLYRTGSTHQALFEWKRDLSTYPPAILARACHEIFVKLQPQQGLEILDFILKKEDTYSKTKDGKRYFKQAENMKSDALAIQHGNVRMVDMNARLAKEEFLSVITP